MTTHLDVGSSRGLGENIQVRKNCSLLTEGRRFYPSTRKTKTFHVKYKHAIFINNTILECQVTK